MATPSRRKRSNLSCRISEGDKKTIEYASKIRGFEDISDYIRMNMLRIAKEDLKKVSLETSLSLSEEEWNRFMKIMEEDTPVNDNLKAAFKALDKIEQNNKE